MLAMPIENLGIKRGYKPKYRFILLRREKDWCTRCCLGWPNESCLKAFIEILTENLQFVLRTPRVGTRDEGKAEFLVRDLSRDQSSGHLHATLQCRSAFHPCTIHRVKRVQSWPILDRPWAM